MGNLQYFTEYGKQCRGSGHIFTESSYAFLILSEQNGYAILMI